MVFHREKDVIICHYCNMRANPVKICPECNDDHIIYHGSGTQRVEEVIKKIVPRARIARMDSDSMSKRGSHERVLKEFKEHKIDVIVGTQMIAKGLDFPKVTMVGVVSADANLNLPDFRSAERTFNLITQVAGRAGRGDLGGEVIVQTFTPEHYALKCSVNHDYNAFYMEEIRSRRELGFPPFVNLVKLTLRGRKEENVETSAVRLAGLLKKKIPHVTMLGPAPSPMAKLRGYYRWNILIKAKDRESIVKELRTAVKGFRKGTGVFAAVDVDPMSL
jgi:primosomal protein N' (replication factor Y)